MDKARILRELEYLSGGINALLTVTKRNSEWHELLDNWATITGSIISALEDEERDAEDT